MQWYHQDSNRGHTDFQSDALPTELWHQLALLSECKGRAFFVTDQTFLYFFIVKGEKKCFTSVVRRENPSSFDRQDQSWLQSVHLVGWSL